MSQYFKIGKKDGILSFNTITDKPKSDFLYFTACEIENVSYLRTSNEEEIKNLPSYDFKGTEEDLLISTQEENENACKYKDFLEINGKFIDSIFDDLDVNNDNQLSELELAKEYIKTKNSTKASEIIKTYDLDKDKKISKLEFKRWVYDTEAMKIDKWKIKFENFNKKIQK